MFISNRSRKGNIIGFACLTTENYNRYLKNYLYVYLLWLFSLICWDLFTSTYFSPENKENKVSTPPPLSHWTQNLNAPSPNLINRASFTGAAIFYNFDFVISPFRHFAISCFKHAQEKVIKQQRNRNFYPKHARKQLLHKKCAVWIFIHESQNFRNSLVRYAHSFVSKVLQRVNKIRTKHFL